MATLEMDSIFLRDHEIMDYSLLLIIESLTACENSSRRNVICSETHPEAYHLGLIDFLQEWNTDKKMERALKRCKKGANDISAVEPTAY